MNQKAFERLLWSIALPGFGQLLNQKYVKGILLLFLELLINVMSNFNEAIISSFHGDTYTSIEQINFQWLMFYPCLYFFAMWDAIKDANKGGEGSPLLFVPFAFTAYFVTVGLIYSTKVTVFGYLIGPIFLPMLFVIPGLVVGFISRKILTFFLKLK